MTSPRCSLMSLSAVALLLIACSPDPDQVVFEMQAHSFAHSEWSEPVNLGAPVNSSAGELNATFSPDELSVYFTSTRAGGEGGDDIWVSHRACVDDCPWQTPMNLGPPVNSASVEGGPNLSVDGHLLFFFSARPGGQGGNDMYVSRRADPKDDFGWGPAVNLGPEVNTSANEAGPHYQQSAENGVANLYFNTTTPGGSQDIYVAPVTRDGETRGPAVLVAELSDPTASDQHVTVRADGREVFIHSNRAGGVGGFDMWMSTRRSVHDPWSTPVNLGAPLNSADTDLQPSLSHDGRTLLFASNRPGGLGGQDLWTSTRTLSGH